MSDYMEILTFGSGTKAVEDPDLKKINPHVPVPTFRVLFNGPSGSGKSMLAKNLIVKEYSKIMDNVFMFCPTIDTDMTLKDMVNEDEPDKSPLNPEHVVRSRDPHEITEIINTAWTAIEARVKANPFYKSLFIFDDLSIELTSNTAIMNLFTKGRKINASIFLMSNKYRSFNPTIRNNLTHLFIFRPNNNMERDSIIDDVRGQYDKSAMVDTLNFAFQTPRAFLYIDRTAEPEKQFRRGFTQILLPQ